RSKPPGWLHAVAMLAAGQRIGRHTQDLVSEPQEMSMARAVVKLEAHGNHECQYRVGRGPRRLVGSPWLARADRDRSRDRLHGAAHAAHDGGAALYVDG